MGAYATARGSTVLVDATRTSRNRPNGSTTAAQSTVASIVDATIAAVSGAAPRSSDGHNADLNGTTPDAVSIYFHYVSMAI